MDRRGCGCGHDSLQVIKAGVRTAMINARVVPALLPVGLGVSPPSRPPQATLPRPWVSTRDQSTDHQIDALAVAGVSPEHMFIETVSGNLSSRPKLDALLAELQTGDEGVVTHPAQAHRPVPAAPARPRT
ncbi:recombinase family protein [Pseudonocardia sp. GCM10023141]|uniref:recombinase family protein n=1 Tax=Pseudonocardia sp. GCM10023141 TaxID=3252653 RepID=UPI003618CB40